MAVIEISSFADLQALAIGLTDWSGNEYRLTDHIDASVTQDPNYGTALCPAGFTMIGNTAGSSNEGFLPISDVTNRFNGWFNGNGYSITGLKINRPDLSWVSLLAAVAYGGICENVNMIDVDIIAYRNAGGVVGTNRGQVVRNCHASGRVEAKDLYGGGLVGGNVVDVTMGIIIRCSSSCTVFGYHYTGGFVGQNNAVIDECFATGDVTATYSFTGGFVGVTNLGTITNCFCTGDVNSPGIANTAGFIGSNVTDVTIYNCFASGNVNGGNQAGGFVGSIDANGGNFSNCYATGNVIGTQRHTGGFVGKSTSGTITNCYSTGIPSGHYQAGGFAGYDCIHADNNCFYDSTASGKSDYKKAIPKTTAQMGLQETFFGWDYEGHWKQLAYPMLRTLLPRNDIYAKGQNNVYLGKNNCAYGQGNNNVYGPNNKAYL